jgi:molybdopterin/thiamine biosynthesis adenylyltransferase
MTVHLRYQRNLGFLSAAEQEALQNVKIAIGGGGGDGGEIARLLVRTGVGCGPDGEIRLADPEVFEAENTNRQTACTSETLGINKAEAVGALLRRINPDARIVVYPEGVTTENLDEFVADADVVVDETDYTHAELAVMLHRACRARGIPLVMGMNIGFGGLVTTYAPDGPSFERHLGFHGTETLEEIAKAEVPLDRWCPYLPPYGDLDVLSAVGQGLKPAPSVAAGVSSIAGATVVEILWLLLQKIGNHRPEPVMFPRALCVDPAARRTRVLRWTRLNYYRHGALLLMKKRLGLAPSTDY